MPETTNRKLPYPAATAAPDVPTAVQLLAEKVDSELTDLRADSDWVTIVPTDSRFSVGEFGAAYRRRGGFVFVQLHLRPNPTTARGLFFTLPAGFRPTRSVFTILNSNGSPQTELRVDPNGQCVLTGTPGNAGGFVGFIVFPVD